MLDKATEDDAAELTGMGLTVERDVRRVACTAVSSSEPKRSSSSYSREDRGGVMVILGDGGYAGRPDTGMNSWKKRWHRSQKDT